MAVVGSEEVGCKKQLFPPTHFWGKEWYPSTLTTPNSPSIHFWSPSAPGSFLGGGVEVSPRANARKKKTFIVLAVVFLFGWGHPSHVVAEVKRGA